MSRAGLSNFATISPACEGGSVKKLNKFQTTNNFRFFSFFLVERSNQNISPLLSKMSVMVSETLKAFWAKNSRMQRMKIFTNQVINNAHQLQLLLFWPNTSVSAHHFTYTHICMYIHSPPPKKKQKQMQSSNQRMYTFFFFYSLCTCNKTPLWASTLGHGFLALPCSNRMSGTTLYSCDTSLNMGSLGRCFRANSRWHVYRGSVLRSTAWP